MQPPEDVIIEATTVGDIGHWSVGVGNIWERDYTSPAGEKKHALSASVSVWHDTTEEEKEFILGVGDVMDLGPDGKWLVTKLTQGKGRENGSIWLEPA